LIHLRQKRKPVAVAGVLAVLNGGERVRLIMVLYYLALLT
jgi:hypothetical protein